MPTHPLPKKDNKNRDEFILLLLLVLLLSSLVIYYTSRNKNDLSNKTNGPSSIESGKKPKAPTSTPTPTPTPRAIPHGKWGFGVGQGDKTVPQFRRGFLDPYDPLKGGTQTVTVNVKHGLPVTKVIGILKTDHKTSQPYEFKLVSGTNTDGQWEGTWTVDDSYLYTYLLTLKAESSDKSSSVDITLR